MKVLLVEDDRALAEGLAAALREPLLKVTRLLNAYIRALQTGQPLKVLPDEIAEKTAQEIEAYPEQDLRHLQELKLILDEEGSDYAA